jgi:hypothetical protein
MNEFQGDASDERASCCPGAASSVKHAEAGACAIHRRRRSTTTLDGKRLDKRPAPADPSIHHTFATTHHWSISASTSSFHTLLSRRF